LLWKALVIARLVGARFLLGTRALSGKVELRYTVSMKAYREYEEKKNYSLS
jgi:hypothetical protein